LRQHRFFADYLEVDREYRSGLGWYPPVEEGTSIKLTMPVKYCTPHEGLNLSFPNLSYFVLRVGTLFALQ